MLKIYPNCYDRVMKMDPVNQPGHIFDGLDKLRAKSMPAPHPGDPQYDPSAKPAGPGNVFHNNTAQSSGRAIQANQQRALAHVPPAILVVTYDENIHEVLRAIAHRASFSWDANPYAPCDAQDAANLALKGHRAYYDIPNDVYRLTRDPHLVNTGTLPKGQTIGLYGHSVTLPPLVQSHANVPSGLFPGDPAHPAPECSCRAHFVAFKKHAELCPLYGGN